MNSCVEHKRHVQQQTSSTHEQGLSSYHDPEKYLGGIQWIDGDKDLINVEHGVLLQLLRDASRRIFRWNNLWLWVRFLRQDVNTFEPRS